MSSDQTDGYILVVDDNEMNRDMLSRRLQRQGYRVDVAENGEQALEMMHTVNYDLVLLDIMMPKMNGYEVLESVKKDQQLYSTPIVMISAVDDLESVVKCIEMGAEDYLFKPFNPVLLKARVGAILEKRRNLQQSSPATKGSLEEIQNAIAAIINDSQTLHSGKAGFMGVEQTIIVDRIKLNAQHILQILDI